MAKKILRNRFRCNRCGTIIESKYCHDFQTCKCGAISCDGGHEYIRLCLEQGLTTEDYQDLCEWEKPVYSDEMQKLIDDVNNSIFTPEEVFGGGSNES